MEVVMSTPNSVPRKHHSDVAKLTAEQRAAVLAKAAEMRRGRVELMENIKRGGASLNAVLAAAETDEVGKLLVLQVLSSLPGVGKIRALQTMEKLKIREDRRVRGLSDQQRKALLHEFPAR
jgi:hypothetical protein